MMEWFVWKGTQLINRFELAAKWNGLQLGPGPNRRRIQLGRTFVVEYTYNTHKQPIDMLEYSKFFVVMLSC